MIKHVLVACLFCVLAVIAMANGGPVDGSSVIGSGNMQFINNPHVELQKEKLTIEILGDYCRIHTIYTLKNTSRESESIKYGFPVDFTYSDIDDSFEWKKHYVKDLSFKLGSDELAYQEIEEFSIIEKEGIFTADSEEGRSVSIKRKWFYTEFEIGVEQVTTLEVDYLVQTNFVEWATSKDFFSSYTQQGLYWDFTPAQYWREGVVDEFEIIIHVPEGAVDNDLLTIDGMEFEKNGNDYRYTARSFDLKSANPLYLNYSCIQSKTRESITSTNITQTCVSSIQASSSRQNYNVDHLLDHEFSTAWVPEGDGIGQWVEIATHPFYFGAIVFVGGYAKSQDTYYNNNRVKKIRLEYTVSSGEDQEYTGEQEIELAEVSYPKNVSDNLYDWVITPFGEGMSNITRFKITILDVYKGKKFDETCISEILLLGYRNDIYGE